MLFFENRFFLTHHRVASRELAGAPAFFSGGLSLVPLHVVQYPSRGPISFLKDAVESYVLIAAHFDNPIADSLGSISDVHILGAGSKKRTRAFVDG